MMVKFSCILCGNSECGLVRHGVRDNADIDVVKCDKCGHIQLFPLPSIEEDKKYYDRDQQMKSLVSVVDEKMIERNKPWINQQVERYAPYLINRKNILEIGSGYGIFLSELTKKTGLNITGLELSEERRRFTMQQFGIKTIELNLMVDDIPEEYKNRFDGIVSFHVLEHISRPQKFLRSVNELIKNDGIIIFEVPNVEEQFLYENEHYNAFKWLRAHVSYYNKTSLYNLFSEVGFRDIKIEGIQNYSIENHLHWMRNGKPSFDFVQIYHPDSMEWINKIYKMILEKENKGDALMVLARK
jgi:2-polyprenyl-3-methyl-5-hydroxy-6-metoxy-1,4-benzoquinol methylase